MDPRIGKILSASLRPVYLQVVHNNSEGRACTSTLCDEDILESDKLALIFVQAHYYYESYFNTHATIHLKVLHLTHSSC